MPIDIWLDFGEIIVTRLISSPGTFFVSSSFPSIPTIKYYCMQVCIKFDCTNLHVNNIMSKPSRPHPMFDLARTRNRNSYHLGWPNK